MNDLKLWRYLENIWGFDKNHNAQNPDFRVAFAGQKKKRFNPTADFQLKKPSFQFRAIRNLKYSYSIEDAVA